jgi:adenine-specific DNA-methyltransferase
MKTPDVTVGNVAKIAALWPHCVTERLGKDGKPELAVDFDKLRAELSAEVLDDGEERYQFTWPDKRAASRLANTPSEMTLRPCREESVGKDGTPGGFDSENLYIEGDNLEVLKLLREDYLGQVKMIYIDPPYNTGNDFVYNDDFAISMAEEEERNWTRDENGFLIVDTSERNTESNGRFHTDWLNMIYPRLKTARELLAEDGVIFISIGQNEVINLTKLGDEVFGATNRISVIGRVMKSGGAKGQFFSPNIEFIVAYAKNITTAGPFREPISADVIKKLYTSVENEGPRKGELYRPFGLYQSSLDARPNQRYFIECPDGSLVIPPGETIPSTKEDGSKVTPKPNDGCWRWSLERYREEKRNGNIVFKPSNGVLITETGAPAKWNVYSKIWLSDRQEDGATPVDLITKWENRHSAKELQELSIPFDFAKPTGLISYLIDLLPATKEAIVLDFFSGSATTAHAVMKLNAEDVGKRKFIMVQLPEVTDEKSEARKAGFDTICEIGKERIRRAGRKVKEEAGMQGQDLDIGFRVLKLDSSNMEDVFYTPEEFNEQNLFNTVDNVKSDRTAEDLLFQVMPELNIPLSAKIEERVINGKRVFVVDDGYLVATFDTDVNTDTVKALAQMKPQYFVMRDASAAGDNVLDDFEQIFRHYSPDTVRKIL